MSYHLRLVKGLSYFGVVNATKQRPDVYVDDEATATAAAASGYFRLVEAGEPAQPQPKSESGKALEDMTVPELETYAAYKGVSLKGITKKADIIAKLKEELGEEEIEGEVDYGSPTMTELQEQK